MNSSVITLTDGLNKEQQTAVEKPLNDFVKIVAGAGTGKTKIISKRYVKLVQDLMQNKCDKPLEHLLVITFTEKAAGEMKSRIMTELNENKIPHFGQENWISTIHSFCSKILRAHAIEAGLSPAFKLGDQNELEAIYTNIIQKIKMEETDQLEFIEDISEELNIDKNILSSENILKLTSINTIEDVLNDIFPLIQQIKSLGITPKQFLKATQQATSDFTNVVRSLPFGYDSKDDYVLGWQRHLEQYADELYEFDTSILNEFATGKIILDKHNSHKKNPCPDWTCAENYEETIDEIAQIETLLVEMAALVYGLYQKHLEEKDLVDFDDLINKTLFILENNEAIRCYYKKHFKHIIVDEFQDTSTAQMKLLLNLMSDEAPDLTVVGDRKQSIYSFRYARMENLDIIQREVEKKFNQKYDSIQLVTNYRSTEPIIDVVNYATKNELLLDELLKANQKEDANSKVKPVNISTIVNCFDKSEYKTNEAKLIAREILDLQKKENVELKDIAVLVNSHAQSDILEEELLKYGIASVKKVNNNYFDKTVVKNVISMFNFLYNVRNELAFVRILKIKFSDRDIYQFKKSVDKISDDNDLNFVEKILQIREKNKSGELNSNKVILEYTQKLFDTIFSIYKDKKTLSLNGIYYRLIDNIKPYYNLSDVNRNLAETDLAIFQKIIEAYSLTQNFVSINNFIEYIKKIKDDKDFEVPQIITKDVNAVNLLTIHASKGLEFPYLFITNLKKSAITSGCFAFELNYGDFQNFGIMINSYNGKTSPKYMVYKTIYKKPKTYQEDLRLFYVALSRAKQYLNVVNHNKTAPEYVNNLIDFYSNITTEIDKDDIVIDKKDIKKIQTTNRVVKKNITAPQASSVLEKTQTMSFSKINLFNHCNHKFLLKYVYGYPEISTNINTFQKGSIVHTLIYNSYLNQKLFDETEIKQYFLNDKIEENKLQEVVQTYETFKKSKYAQLNNVLTEYNFNFKYKDFVFNGDIDLLSKNDDGTYNVIDFKTNKNLELSFKDYTKQMYIYKMAMENQGLEIKNLYLVNLLPSEINCIELSENDINEAKIALDNDINNIQKAYNQEIEIRKNKQNCSNCGYKYLCNG